MSALKCYMCRICMLYWFVVIGSVSIAAKSELKNTSSISISRKHLAVWFDYSVRYYDHEADNAYSKIDLRVMINVVSKRFSKIAIESAPDQYKLPPAGADIHSRIWVPQVVAEYNKDHYTNNSSKSSSPHQPMEVVVSFDVAKISSPIFRQVTSFDVAKYMADTANTIFPGTVKTMMMYTGFSLYSNYFSVKDTVLQLKEAKGKLNGKGNSSSANSQQSKSSQFNYDLAVFLDLKDCGHFKGPLGQKAKEFLPHVDIIVTLLRPNYHQMTFTPDIIHKMFTTKFEDCERKLKEEKPGIRVIPSVLWMARKQGGSGPQGMAKCWQMMSDWAKKKNTEVIMYEAFDTPNGHLLSDQGWWGLTDKAEHEITENLFVENIQGFSQDSSSLIPWQESDESGDSENSVKTNHRNNNFPAETRASPQNALYIVLVLLSVICTLLVAVVVGLVYSFRSMLELRQEGNYRRINNNRIPNGHLVSRGRWLERNSTHHPRRLNAQDDEVEDEDGGSGSNGVAINNGDGSVLEIRDTTPIIAVSYKK